MTCGLSIISVRHKPLQNIGGYQIWANMFNSKKFDLQNCKNKEIKCYKSWFYIYQENVNCWRYLKTLFKYSVHNTYINRLSACDWTIRNIIRTDLKSPALYFLFVLLTKLKLDTLFTKDFFSQPQLFFLSRYWIAIFNSSANNFSRFSFTGSV